MPSDFLFRSATPVSDTGLPIPKIAGIRFQPASLRQHRHTPSVRTYSTPPLSPYRRKPTTLRTYGNTHAHPLSPNRRKPTSSRRYGHTPARPLSPNRRKPHQKHRYGHTHSRRVFPYRRKTVFRVGMGIPAYLHHPHTNANPPHRVGTDMPQPVHYPHTNAKPHSTKYAGCMDETSHPRIPHDLPQQAISGQQIQPSNQVCKQSHHARTGSTIDEGVCDPVYMVCDATSLPVCSLHNPARLVCTEYCGKSDDAISQRIREPAGTFQQMSHIRTLTLRTLPGSYGSAPGSSSAMVVIELR